MIIYKIFIQKIVISETKSDQIFSKTHQIAPFKKTFSGGHAPVLPYKSAALCAAQYIPQAGYRPIL